jgi:uncharacterized membrane protein (DUF373 family)
MPVPQPGYWQQARTAWPMLSYYQRFEAMVALVLTAVIGLIILVALYRLTYGVLSGLLGGILDPLDPRAFQNVFGEIMTLLIALEFNHTLQYVIRGDQSIVQTKVVLLVAVLAVARKFIVLDLMDSSVGELFALAAVTAALGAAYWLMRERDDRLLRQPPVPVSNSADLT